MFIILLLGEGPCLAVIPQKEKDVLERLPLYSQFHRISKRRKNETPDEVIDRLQAFAKKHPKHDLAGEAHLKIAHILLKKDTDDGVEKLKWVAVNFPKAKKEQYHFIGRIPNSMFEEWRDYVKQHPILIKDCVWYELAKLYKSKKVKRYKDALAAYDNILSTVKPENYLLQRIRQSLPVFVCIKEPLKQR